jgi:hypothetical protein
MGSENSMNEPTITINGHLLNDAQASTVRCAIEALASLIDEDASGPCEIGAIGQAYKLRIAEIRSMIFSRVLDETKEAGVPGLRNYGILSNPKSPVPTVDASESVIFNRVAPLPARNPQIG